MNKNATEMLCSASFGMLIISSGKVMVILQLQSLWRDPFPKVWS